MHLDFPFAGSRMLRDLLNADGVEIGRLHVATLMKRMGIEAIYRKPNTSKPAPGHKIHPYLLRKMQAVRPESGLGHGYYVHPDGARLRLSRRRGRLVQPPGSQPSGVDHHGSRLLHRGYWKKLSPAMADQRSSTRIKARSSPARPSRMFFSKPASLSAWTARAHGATMSSSSGFGDPSNTRRCISEPTRQWRRLAPRSPVIFASIIPADHIRALTGRRQIRPISTGCRRSRRPEPGRHSTYQTGKTAQTNRASSAAHHAQAKTNGVGG